MTITCVAAGFKASETPATPSAKSSMEQLADLKALVSGTSMLKDPFKSELLANLDDATTALGDKAPDQATAKLDDFIAGLQTTPVAQLTPEKRVQLTDNARRIQKSIGAV
jgi:hypothetical protein